MTLNDSRIWAVCAYTSGPASCPVLGLTPAVPPMLINWPTLAIWLYGPMGVGVLTGVEVSTVGGIVPPNRVVETLSSLGESRRIAQCFGAAGEDGQDV